MWLTRRTKTLPCDRILLLILLLLLRILLLLACLSACLYLIVHLCHCVSPACAYLQAWLDACAATEGGKLVLLPAP